MTVTIDRTAKRGYASFKRTIQTKQYETATGEVFVEFDLDDNEDNWATQATTHLGLVQTVVLDGLGIEYTIQDGLVVEGGRAAKPAAVASQAEQNVAAVFGGDSAAAPSDAAAPTAGDDAPPYSVPKNADDRRVQPKHEKDANAQWAVDRFKRFPGEFYDNRADKADGKANVRGPDIKHKSTGLGAWL